MVLHHWGHPKKFLQHRKMCPSGAREGRVSSAKRNPLILLWLKTRKKKGGAARIGLYLVLRTELLPTNLGVDAFGVPSNRHIPPYKKEIHRLKSAVRKGYSLISWRVVQLLPTNFGVPT